MRRSPPGSRILIAASATRQAVCDGVRLGVCLCAQTKMSGKDEREREEIWALS